MPLEIDYNHVIAFQWKLRSIAELMEAELENDYSEIGNIKAKRVRDEALADMLQLQVEYFDRG